MQRKILTTAALFVLSTGVAFAATPHPYAGAGYGTTDMDSGVSGLTGSASVDEKDNGYRVFGGMDFGNNFSAEVAYSRWDNAAILDANAGDMFRFDGTTYQVLANGAKIDLDGYSVALSGRYTFPLTNQFGIFAKAGLHSWKFDTTTSAPGLGSFRDSFSGTDLLYGGGAGFKLTPHLSADVQYERYDLSEGLNHLDMITGNLAYHF
jgi:OOP family OmpA-OmpF porin